MDLGRNEYHVNEEFGLMGVYVYMYSPTNSSPDSVGNGLDDTKWNTEKGGLFN